MAPRDPLQHWGGVCTPIPPPHVPQNVFGDPPQQPVCPPSCPQTPTPPRSHKTPPDAPPKKYPPCLGEPGSPKPFFWAGGVPPKPTQASPKPPLGWGGAPKHAPSPGETLSLGQGGHTQTPTYPPPPKWGWAPNAESLPRPMGDETEATRGGGGGTLGRWGPFLGTGGAVTNRRVPSPDA